MPCKAPAFWWSKPGAIATLLKPVAGVYQAVSRMNSKGIAPYTPSIPVICVGNIVAGGSGKTPAVQAISALLHEENIAQFPVILLRGYGGKLKGPTSVNLMMHNYKEVGDEALLHAEHAPTIIAQDRVAGVKLAQLGGADMVFMDDGLQNPSVTKTVSFLMVDEEQGLGNGLTIPAGPLREPLHDALTKADAIILNGKTLPFETDKPVFRASIEPLARPEDKLYIAFAGLGRPEKFKQTLSRLSVKLIGWHVFPDHHPYSEKDIQTLIDEASRKGASLITTAKDHIRLPESFRDQVTILHVHMALENSRSLASFIKSKLRSA
jgi:tetraacyldisaccharide 4'-kinase